MANVALGLSDHIHTGYVHIHLVSILKMESTSSIIKPLSDQRPLKTEYSQEAKMTNECIFYIQLSKTLKIKDWS